MDQHVEVWRATTSRVWDQNTTSKKYDRPSRAINISTLSKTKSAAETAHSISAPECVSFFDRQESHCISEEQEIPSFSRTETTLPGHCMEVCQENLQQDAENLSSTGDAAADLGGGKLSPELHGELS